MDVSSAFDSISSLAKTACTLMLMLIWFDANVDAEDNADADANADA